MNSQAFGKWIVLAGVFLVVIGIVVSAFGKIPFIGRLPGDILIRRGGTTIYLPITTCILLSIIITVLLRLFRS